MRVRPLRPATTTRPRTERRPHAFERPADAEPAVDEHLAERRHRASVAPEDNAHYACSCGFSFQAAVSTSVCCPHCGTGQAW
jgi:hypothetical protein